MNKIEPYSTIAKNGSAIHTYHDRDSIPFQATYPLVDFTDMEVTIGASSDALLRCLIDNYWYQKANSYERQLMLERVQHVNQNLEIVIEFIEKKYAPLGFEIYHISIAGSYIYAPDPGDIDFNVVLTGSFFDYVTFNEGIEILDTTGSIQKVSLTLMGLDNILGSKQTNDDIRNEGFVHHDTIAREMLVAPMRNVTVFGHTFDNKHIIDTQNVMVRVARQLYFAQLTLEGKIPYYETEPLRTRKAVKRIKEAQEIIDWLLITSELFHK